MVYFVIMEWGSIPPTSRYPAHMHLREQYRALHIPVAALERCGENLFCLLDGRPMGNQLFVRKSAGEHEVDCARK